LPLLASAELPFGSGRALRIESTQPIATIATGFAEVHRDGPYCLVAFAKPPQIEQSGAPQARSLLPIHGSSMGGDRHMKRPFLTLYEYDEGAVWTVLLADSADEVRMKYPELLIIDQVPSTMGPDELRDIESQRTLDVDDTTDPLLASLRENRG
jgi:hypothetical protein